MWRTKLNWNANRDTTRAYVAVRVVTSCAGVCRLCYDQVHRLSSYRVTGVQSSEKRSTPLYFQNTPNRHGSLGISSPSLLLCFRQRTVFNFPRKLRVSYVTYVHFLLSASFVEREFIEFGRGYNAFSLLS